MTDIRPGMAVHLVKMPDRSHAGQHISDRVILGQIGRVRQRADCGVKEAYTVEFPEKGRVTGEIFWIPREFIEPTSPYGVTVHVASLRENGFYWVRDGGVWTVCELRNGFWSILGCELGWQDGDFEQIGPRIEKPEGL